jgi:hypothetical protein
MAQRWCRKCHELVDPETATTCASDPSGKHDLVERVREPEVGVGHDRLRARPMDRGGAQGVSVRVRVQRRRQRRLTGRTDRRR